MATAAIYGLLASSSFVVGVLLGLATKPPRRLLAVIIAFGAGVLVSALTFDLMCEAFERETGAYAIGGFLVGAVIYVLADAGLERLAARSPNAPDAIPRTWFPALRPSPRPPRWRPPPGLRCWLGR
jgi:zinc transporter ZupT